MFINPRERRDACFSLCCFGRFLEFVRCFRLGLRRCLFLRSPESLHSLGLLFALSGRELAAWFLRRLSTFRRAGNGSGQWILRRPSPALSRPFKRLDGSVQLVSFRNQKSKNLFCRHRKNRNTIAFSSLRLLHSTPHGASARIVVLLPFTELPRGLRPGDRR